MTNVNIQKETKISRAVLRLEEAVEVLDSALSARIEESSGGDDKAAVLMEELTSLRADNAQLKLMNKTVSGRLNGTIGRLQTVLEA